jgi:hypothetical protein
MLRPILIALLFYIPPSVAGAADYISSWPPPINGPQQQTNKSAAQQSNAGYDPGAAAQHPSFSECQQSINENAKGDGDAGHDKQKVNETDEYWVVCGYRVKITDTLLVVFTFLLTGVTALLVVVGELQRRQLKRTNDQAAAIERAYVFAKVKLVSDWNLVGTDGNKNAMINVIFGNRGKTHAAIQRVHWRCILRVNDETAPQDFGGCSDTDETWPQGLVIAAGRDRLHPIKPGQPSETVDKIMDGTLVFFVIGFIDYLDIHKVSHQTSFCWHYMPELSGPGMGSKPRFIISPNTPLNHHS